MIAAVNEVGVRVPVVVRLEGTNAEIGRQILVESDVNILTAQSLQQAAELAVNAAKENTNGDFN